jgi:hypothetical protein
MGKGIASIAVIGLAAALGCTTPMVVPGPCASSRDCPTGLACVDMRCVAAPDGACASGCECDADCIREDGGSSGVDAGADDAGAAMDAPTSIDAPMSIDAPTPRVDAPPGDLGSACRGDRDCAPVSGRPAICAMRVSTIDLPGGYCTAMCTASAECGRDGVCVRPILAGPGYCMRRCTSARECRTAEGYACRMVPGASTTVCAP